MKILVIDNYDSFTYNLVQLVQECLLASEDPTAVRVARNDKISVPEIQAMAPARIIISPGPGDPSNGGVSAAVIASMHRTTPILGVCLGHQILAEHFGASVCMSHKPCHGKTSKVTHTTGGIFRNIPSPMTVARYHSLHVRADSIHPPLAIEARSEDGTVMGIRHQDFPLYGVQFHPESFLTPDGRQLMQNFLDCREIL